MKKYDQFISSKQWHDVVAGFDCETLNKNLFEFQSEIVRWALKRGRAAIFADTGLGKTAMQLEWAHQVSEHTQKNVLIIAPLCVAQQTIREGKKFDIQANYCRSQDQVKNGLTVTNYEMVDSFDLTQFVGVVLDESSILKHQMGKTRTKLIKLCQRVPYRLSCTATPSPNDHMELANQAEFLGLMSANEMLSMFFTHDGGETSKWRLKGHGKSKFWQWMATWSVCIRKPSDLGFDNTGYDLPALNTHEHVVDVAKPLEGELFARDAQTLSERRQAQRDSIEERCNEAAGVVNNSKEQHIVWCHLNAESDLLADLIPDSVQVKGSDSIEQKESAMLDFVAGRVRVLVSKPSIFGFGMNLQHCNQMVFVGLSDSYEQYYQAIRRCYRFGQKKPVDVHIVISDGEGAVRANIERKAKQAEDMQQSMVEHMREFTSQIIKGAAMEKTDYVEDMAEGEGWTLHLGDCVKIAEKMDSDTIGYSIFSPPFASLYTYSNSDYDMGNVKDDDEFYQQFKYLVKELYRITQPGRLVSFHCMNLPTTKSMHGFIGMRDFRGELIRLFSEEGWIYHSEVCIWKDPVTAMQRTKALGLLWKQIKKDSAMNRQGIPDFLVTMRKPGDNPNPISHSAEDFPVDRWQQLASPVWMDINQSRTLQYREARENDDERHICPLQLDVIERGLELWSKPGDLVFSPFAGIGSEGYCALKMQRQFVGAELKRSYWELAKKNIEQAKAETMDLFAA